MTTVALQVRQDPVIMTFPLAQPVSLLVDRDKGNEDQVGADFLAVGGGLQDPEWSVLGRLAGKEAKRRLVIRKGGKATAMPRSRASATCRRRTDLVVDRSVAPICRALASKGARCEARPVPAWNALSADREETNNRRSSRARRRKAILSPDRESDGTAMVVCLKVL